MNEIHHLVILYTFWSCEAGVDFKKKIKVHALTVKKTRSHICFCMIDASYTCGGYWFFVLVL
jgi:hypothetical protein